MQDLDERPDDRPGERPGERPSPARGARPVRLTGWGRTAPSTARVLTPGGCEAAASLAAVREAGGAVIARGLGRSYGDSAQARGGYVLDTSRMRRLLEVDVTRGVVRCEAGVTLEDLMRRMLPLGWWVPVTPGTRQVTVGGAVAADVHGKNHHVAGSFGGHLLGLSLLTADGAVREVSPEPGGDPELFWATVGGMGLTGVVVRATLRMAPVESSLLRVDTVRTPDLDSCLAQLKTHDQEFGHTVAWVDALARGRRLGRSVVTSGDFARLADLPARLRDRPGGALEFRPRTLGGVPDAVPGSLLNRHSAAAFNALWYGRAPRRREGELQSAGRFFHPLDGVRDWNRLYGRSGLVQYQFVVPEDRADVVEKALTTLSGRRAPAFLTVLKRFGPGNSGHLSFPRAGWTLAVDVPARTPGLTRVLRTLDEAVLEAEGRIYLAKDVRMPAAYMPLMYPRLGEFQAVRDRVDPGRLFVSDQARRLGL